ncbi:MAG: GNAT family N-acetyltransferase [Bacillota bacterium]
MASGNFTIAEIGQSLRSVVQPLIDGAWAGPMIAVNGRLWDTRKLPGIAALDESGEPVGYLLYAFHGGVCEIMALESLRENKGIATRLIERVKRIAKERGVKKVTVMTTNDNIRAIRFYQMRGFTLRALRPNMLEISRRLKPEIPLTGAGGIPIRDEIEFEIEV